MRLTTIVVLIALAALTGCTIKIHKIKPVPTTTDYTAYSCEALDAERVRIEKGLFALYTSHRPGTIDAVRKLKGEMDGANDAIMRNGCRVPLVKIPTPPKKPKLRYTGGAPTPERD